MNKQIIISTIFGLFSKRNWSEIRIINLLFLLTVFIVLLFKGYLIAWDTDSYINNSIFRAPGYLLLIDLFQLIFGDKFKTFLYIFQLLFGFASIIIFERLFYQVFNMDRWLILLVSLVLLAPYFHTSNVGNYILSESIAYPLSLLFSITFIKGIVKNENRFIIISAIILFMAILVRGQMIAAVPITIVVIIINSILKNRFRKDISSILIFIAVFLVSNLADKTYRSIVYGHYYSTPWTGIHLAALPFFVSDAEDSILFNNAKEKEYFNKIYSELVKQDLTYESFQRINNYESRGYEYYADNSTNIANFTIDRYGREFFSEYDENTRFVLNDKISKRIAVVLIKDNFFLWIKFYIMNIVAGIGFERYIFMFPLLFLTSIILLLSYKLELGNILFFFLGTSFSNMLIVALVQPLTFYRYTIYGDFLFYISIILIIDIVLKYADLGKNNQLNILRA